MFYDEQGKELSVNDFIAKYESYYFMGDNSKTKKAITVNVDKKVSINTTKRFAENMIEKILEDGIKNPLDVKHILAWKVGAINMQKSDETGISYHPDWGDDKGDIKDRVPMPRYTNNYFQLKELAKYIAEKAKNINIRFKGIDSDEVQGIIREYCNLKMGNKKKRTGESKDGTGKNKFDHIGIVYMITFLYFMTGGFVPIYDKYVHIALKALKSNKKPGSLVFYSGPADNGYKTFMSLMDEYTQLITDVLEIEGRSVLRYQENESINHIRSLDRALWVYGHLFNLD